MTDAFIDAAFWDERYGDDRYAYGTQPNDFLRDQSALFKKGDAILSLAEGEGRNAVFLAQKGCRVRGVDFSAAGREKALQLAEKHRVSIDYDLDEIRCQWS